jgi:hypothetical protein
VSRAAWSALLAAAALAGCGGGHGGGTATTTTTAPPATTAVYLSQGPTYVDLLQWTQQGGTIRGTARATVITGQPPLAKVTTTTYTVTGDINGGVLEISFNGSPSSDDLYGSGSLTVSFPQPGGTLAPTSFTAATMGAFAAAVVALGHQATADNSDQAAIVGANQQAEQIVHAEAGMQSDAAAAPGYLKALASEEQALAGNVIQVSGGIQGANQLLATVESQVQKVEADIKNPDDAGAVCGDAAGAAGDASGVGDDTGGLAGDATGVQADVTAVRATIASLTTVVDTYQADGPNAPGYSPPTTLDVATATEALTTANSDVMSAVTTTNQALAQANTDTDTAFGDVAQAYQAAGTCGAPPATPAPVKPIT